MARHTLNMFPIPIVAIAKAMVVAPTPMLTLITPLMVQFGF
jgi:hypothetical protein